MCGNYQVIIQEFLYYVKEIDKQQTNIIVKYDISKKEKIYEKKLDQSFILNNKPDLSLFSKPSNHFVPKSSLYNSKNNNNNEIILISQKGILYAIYERLENNSISISISIIDKDNLSIIKTWDSKRSDKLSNLGFCFMIDYIIYFINDKNASPTKIVYSFNLKTMNFSNLDIEFENKGGNLESIYFDDKANSIITLNNKSKINKYQLKN